MQRRGHSVSHKLSNKQKKQRQNRKRENASVMPVWSCVLYVIGRYTPDRFANEPDNMFRQQMPSIILNSYGRAPFLFLPPNKAEQRKRRTNWALYCLKLFPLRLIYFLKSPSRFVASNLLLYVLYFFAPHHKMVFECVAVVTARNTSNEFITICWQTKRKKRSKLHFTSFRTSTRAQQHTNVFPCHYARACPQSHLYIITQTMFAMKWFIPFYSWWKVLPHGPWLLENLPFNV